MRSDPLFKFLFGNKARNLREDGSNDNSNESNSNDSNNDQSNNDQQGEENGKDGDSQESISDIDLTDVCSSTDELVEVANSTYDDDEESEGDQNDE